MDELLKVVSSINSYLSDYVLITLLVGAGVYFSIRTRFVQVRCFGEGFRKAFGNFSLHGKNSKNGLSSFQALATAVAAQVGTGNIVGASGAILIGGLAQNTRIQDADGVFHGGPVYYIKKAYPNAFGKFLAVFFAVALTISLGFMGCMVQANSIGETCRNAFNVPTWVVGLIIASVATFIFIGGIKRIAIVTEKQVPLMAII